MSHPEVVASTWQTLLAELEDWGPRPGADVGSPHMSGRILTSVGNVETGLWQCTPGGWPVADRPDAESVIILAGRARLTDESGRTTDIAEGSTVVFPQGWYGRWDISETIVKFYVSVK